MKISEKGLELIKGFESFVPYVYDDKRPMVRGRYAEWKGEKPIGTLTIGYGHTDAAKHPLKISLGLRITEAQALEILDVDLDECEDAVNRLVKVKITQGQFDALVSFAFNCGAGNLKKLIRPLNAGNYDACRRDFDQFIRSKGEVMRGLQRRRDAEQVLWDQEDVAPWVVAVEHPAEVDGPPNSAAPATMAQSTEGNTALMIGTGGSVSTSVEISGAVSRAAVSPRGFSVTEVLIQLASSPTFWLGVATVAGAAYLWLRRRHRLLTFGV